MVNPKEAELRAGFRPSVTGTLTGEFPSKAQQDYSKAPLFNFTQGFNAVVSPNEKAGVVFLPDYNMLKCLYTYYEAVSQEWWYDSTFFHPGSSFETEFLIVPFFGLSRVDFADSDYIMSKEITRDGNMAEININILTEKQDIITIEAYEYPKMKLLGKSVAENSKGKLALNNVTGKTDILFKVRFPEKDFEAFSPGVAVLGEETQYKIPPPKKIKNIEKPDLTVRKQNEIPNILEAKGLFANTYRFNEISQKQGWEYTPSYYSIGEMGTRLAYFPETYDYETINKYDLIIMNHIPADAYNESTWDFLYDYVSYGGKILFIGGPMCICGYDKDNDYS
ncbi:MAG: hypothetical protein KBT47_01555, partial [Armatimonadetes bacterium]|nr:hypothetical protein [Candidatus Hippobium faecium]